MRKRNYTDLGKKLGLGAYVLMMLLVVSFMGWFLFGFAVQGVAEFGMATKQIRVEKMDARGGGNNNRRNFIYTTERELFIVRDSLLDWKWDSEQTYHDMYVGHCYEVQYRSVRKPLFDLFPNIVYAREIPCQ